MAISYKNEHYEVKRDKDGKVTTIILVQYAMFYSHLFRLLATLTAAWWLYDKVRDVQDIVTGFGKLGVEYSGEAVRLIFGINARNVIRGAVFCGGILLSAVCLRLRDSHAKRTPLDDDDTQELLLDPAFIDAIDRSLLL